MNQNDRLLDELRGYLPEYMAQKRMVVGRGKKLIRCINPQHSDSTPSMSYYPKTKKLHCFGCGATYDLFDVIRMDYPDCDSFPRQVKKACELFGVPFPEDFGREHSVVVRSAPHAGARKYLSLPFFCDLVSYGGNVVASVAPEAEAAVRAYVERYAPEHCFETPNMNVLADALRPFGMRICFMAEYFLPDVSRMRQWDCGYALKVLGPADFAGLYRPEWSNALCEKRRELDVLAVGAYDGARLVGLAGCSADCESMWQIGVDVLPGYRRRGVAAALTSRLAAETLARGKVPFYCAAWSNIKSVRNAVKCGFVPAWAELTAKPEAFVRELNGQ